MTMPRGRICLGSLGMGRSDLASRITRDDVDILLGVYRERYAHLRHFQQMRAAYFNFYLAIVGISVAAAVPLYLTSPRTVPDEAKVLIPALVWLISILTMVRAERWGGHISHEIRYIRNLEGALAANLSTPATIGVRSSGDPLRSVEYDRPLWSRDRSIDVPASFIGGILSAIIFIALASPLNYWGYLGALGVIAVPWLWRSEVAHLRTRHELCCEAGQTRQTGEDQRDS